MEFSIFNTHDPILHRRSLSPPFWLLGLVILTSLWASAQQPGDIAIYLETAGGEALTTADFDHDFTAPVVREDASYSLSGTQIDLQAGHYVVIYNVGWEINPPNHGNRREIQTKLNLAGGDSPYGWSQSYIRESTGQQESINAGGSIIKVDANGDDLILRSLRTDNNGGSSAFRQVAAGEQTPAAIQLLRLPDKLDYCLLYRSTDTSGPTTATFQNVTYDVQDELETDSFGHSAGSGDITLKTAGHYLVAANTYLFQSVDRSSLVQKLTLNGADVAGSTTTVYIRGNQNSASEGAASIMMIVDTTAIGANATLNVEVGLDVNRSPTTITGNKTAISIVKLPDTANFIRLDGPTHNANTAAADAVNWDTEDEEDAAGFTHDTVTNNERVNVVSTGDHLFLSALYVNNDGVARGFWQQGWSVTGVASAIGESGRYTRNGGGADQAGNWAGFIGNNLTGGVDYVETTTRQLGNGGTNNAVDNGLQGVRIADLIINDAPVLTALAGLAPAASTDSNTTKDITVSDVISAGGPTVVTDADDLDNGENMAVVGVTALGNGTWQYSSNGAASFVTFSAALGTNSAVLLSSSGQLRYIPDPLGGGGDATYTFHAWDETVSSVGDIVNATTTGGTTEFSANSEVASVSIVDANNNAPELVAVNPQTLGGLTENDAAQTFLLTNLLTESASIILTQITDADETAGSQIKGIAVTGVNVTNGTWQWSTDGGANFIAFTGTETDSLATLVAYTNGQLRFIPDPDNGETLTSVTFRAWDQQQGSNGQAGVDASSNGGNKAFSSAAEVLNLVVVNVNDAPTVTAAPPELTAMETLATSSHALSTLITNAVSTTSTQITDVDTGATNGIIVTGTSGLGTWQYSTNSGGAYLDIGVVSANSGRVLVETNSLLRYIGSATAETAAVTYQAWDGTDGSANSAAGIDGSVNGGTTAFSAAQDVASLAVLALVAAADDTTSTDEDTVATTVDPGATASLMANDSNVGAAYGFDTTSFAGATVTVNTDGTFQYDHTALTFFGYLDVGETRTDTFRYYIANGTSATDAWTVTAWQIAGGGGSTDNDINSLAEATRIDNAVRSAGVVTANDGTNYNVNQYTVVNSTVVDYGSGGGNDFPNNLAYPGTTQGDDIFVKAQATVIFPPGTYRVAVNSDDRSLLRITGVTFDSVASATQTAPNELENTNNAEGIATFTVSTATTAHILGMFYERGGGDYFEIAIDADGDGDGTSFPGDYELFSPGVHGISFLNQDEADVTVTVQGTNDPPAATDNFASTDEDTVLTVEAYAAAVIGDGPVLYYRMNEYEGTSTIVDSSGNGRDGALTDEANVAFGATSVVANSSDRAFDFSGNGTHMIRTDMNTTDFAATDYSVEFWFNSDDNANDRDIFALTNNSNQHGILIELESSGRIRLLHRAPFSGTSFDVTTANNTYTQNVWHHLVLTMTGGTRTLYIDSVAIAVDAGVTNFGPGIGTRAVIGRLSATNTSRRFDGTLDEFALFNRALSAIEVSEHFNFGSPGGLLDNDSDPEGHVISLVSADGNAFAGGLASFTSTNGAAITVSTSGSFSFDPTGVPDFQALATGEQATDSFTYTIQDSAGATAVATAVITINGISSIEDDSYTLSEDTLLVSSDLSGNATPTDSGDNGFSANDHLPSVTPTAGFSLEWFANDPAADDGNDRWESSAAAAESQNANRWDFTAPLTFTAVADDRFTVLDKAVQFPFNGNGATLPGSWQAGIGVGDDSQSDFSIEIVFQADDVAGNHILWETGGSGDGSYIALLGNTVESHSKDGGQNIEITSGGVINAGQFYHLFYTFDISSGTGRLYLDGSLIGSDVNGGVNDWAGTDGSGLGRVQGSIPNSPSGMSNFDGKIALVRYYAAPFLTPAQINTNLNALVSPSVVEADSNALVAGTVTFTSSVLGATVTVTSNGGFTYDPSGSAIIQALIEGATATDSFVYEAEEPGNSSNSGTATVVYTITGLNDAPTLSGTGTFTAITEDDTSNSGDTVTNILGATDSDPDTGSVVGIAIVSTTASNGTWQYDTGGGFTNFPTVNSSTGLLLLPANSVRFLPDTLNGSAPSITYHAWDTTDSGTAGTTSNPNPSGGTTAYSASTESATLTNSDVNDAPEFDGSGTPTFTGTNEDTISPAETVATMLLTGAGGDPMTDVDNGAVEGIAIYATANNGTWQYDTGGGFTSFPTVNESTALLLRATDTVRYVPDGLNGETATISFYGWDQAFGTAGLTSNAVTRGGTTAFSTNVDVASLISSALNDAPSLDNSGTPSILTTDEDTNSPATAVSAFLATGAGADPLTDPDFLPLEGIGIIATSGNGTWQYDTGGGFTSISGVTASSALLLRATDSLRYVPDQDNGETAFFTFLGWDQFAGTAGVLTNPNPNGGTTAYSTALDVGHIIVTHLNDAPVLDDSDVMDLTTITENETLNTGELVQDLINFSTANAGNAITDVDLPADPEGWAIVGSDVTGTGGGTWQYSTDSGATWVAMGTVNFNSALLLRAGGATDLVRFVPDAANATTANLTIYAWDQNTNSASERVDLATIGTGGTTAFSTEDEEDVTILVTAINDPPIISGTQQVTGLDDEFDTAVKPSSAFPFSTVTIIDVDLNPADNLTLTVTMDDCNKGSLDVGATGFAETGAGTRIYTYAAVNAGSATTAIRGLLFYPFENRIYPGSFDTSSFTIAVNDGTDTASDSATTVEVESINDVPEIVNTTTGQTVQDDQFLKPFEFTTLTDDDNNPGNRCTNAFTPAQVLGVSVVLDSGAKGELQHRISMPGGLAADNIDVWASTPSGIFDGVEVEFVNTLSDGTANATYNSANRRLIVNITSGVTCAYAVVDAVNALTGAFAFSAEMNNVTDANPNPGNDVVFAASSGMTSFSHLTQVSSSVYVTNTGNRDTVKSLLRILTFEPTEDRVGPGSTETTTLFVTMTDGLATVSDNTTTVISHGQNDAPTIPAQTLTVSEDAIIGTDITSLNGIDFLTTFLGADDDPGHTAALTYGIRPPGGSGAAAFSIALNGTITVADSSLIDFETNTLFKLEIIATDPLGATNGSFFEQKLGACNPATDDFLGSSVAVDGDYIAIGAKFADIGGDVDAGAVYVFEKSGLAWQQVSRLLPSVVAAGGNFGSAVALSGNLLLIGAEGQDQAFLFQRIGGSWTEITGPIVGSDTAGGDSFGASVDIDGTNYVIGAPLNDADGTDAGAAYLFGAVTTKLVPSDIQIGDLVGASVAIDGTSAIVSAPNEDSGGVDAGSAYVFVNGTEQGKLSPSDGQNADQFGTDVDIVGDTAIIGSALHDSEAFAAGAAYVFVRVAGVWEQQEKLVASDAALSDNFGAAVAITDELSNLTVAIGSPFDDDAGTDSGSIYTFVRDVNTNWLQDLKETADDGAADDRFGSRIDLDGKQLVVGAHFADVTKNATLYQDSGASYVINVDRGEICIVVVDANDPPVIADGSFTIDENVANLTAVGTVDSSDEDVADVLTHVIDAGNGGGAFQITAAGELQVLNLPGLNFEFTNSYVLTVRVNDNGAPSLSDTASITVTVNDINEAPVATDAIYTVDEHTAIGSQITTLNVTDEDSGQSLAHTITSGNSAGIFALDVNTGAITVANDTLLDFELTTSYTLTVLVVDNGSPSLSDTATITINVNDLNEAPVAVNVTYSILEDATAGTPVGTAGATDPDGDALIYNFTAGNTNTAFNIDGAGNITVNNPADFEATSQYVLSLDITDTGPLTTAITVTINLVEVNEDPVLVCPPGPGTMDELTTLSLTATATDSDLPAQTLTFSLGASTTALGVGINSSTGEFSWTPSEAQGPGVYNLTVCVSDTIATVCTTLSITVDDINSPPTLAAIGDKSAIEGIQLTFTAVGDDTDIPAQTISFSLNDPGGTGASIDGAGNFVWTPNANQGSVGGTPYVMSVIVTDSSGLSTSEQITITVYEAAASVGTPACWMNVAGLDLGPGSDVTRRVLDEPGEHRTFQAGAISCGCILGDNGFVQTTVDETTSSRMFGLSDDNDQGQHFSDILYAMFLDSNGQLSIYEEGGQAESFDAVTYVSGDILRVEVVGTTVNYLQNGLILYTSTRLVSQSDYPLKFDISMQTDGATLRDNVMSPQVPASPRIVDFVANDPSHTDNVLSAGDTLQIYFDSATNQPGGSVDSLFQFSQGLGSSYSGSWNNASCYGVTILDASGNGSPTIGVTTVSPLPGGTAINDASGASAASYVVSPVLRGDFGTTEPNTSGITWQNFINSAATPNSNDLLESSLNNHDYGAAVSVETFAYGDISIHFVPDQTDAEIFFGFTSLIGNSSSDPADIRYAAVLKTDGTFGAQTAETFQPDLGLSTYQAGDLITISIVGTTVTFYINGNLVHTSPVPVDPSDFPLAVDVSIGTGSISNARYSSSANVNAPPQLVSVVGNDPDDGDRILSGGDTITFTFDQATNQPTGQFASLFSSSATIGQTFSGGWTSALAYTVTITNPAGSTLTLDSSSFAVAGSTPITNAAGTSGGADASFGSITLSGDWGIVPLTAGNVVWENSTNATDGGGGTLNKTGSSNAWDAYGDSSASYLFGPAYTELAVVTVDQAYLFGFDVTGARPHNDTAAFGIKVDTFNTLHVLEGISQIGTFGTVRASDVLRVAIDAAGAVTYLKNDQVFYTSAQTASFPLEIVGSIFSGSGSIDGLVRSDPPVSFPPVLNSAIADDPDNLDEIVSNGDTITLKTDIATNSPGGAGVQAKAAVDALFTASVSLGGDYIGQWVTASCFRITLVNVSGEGGLTIDQTTLTPAGTTPILDAAGTSPASSASSPALAGDFGDVRNPGEDAIWTALYNVTVLASEPNTLCKSDTADVNQPAGAVTDQTIARNTRGEAYIEVDARVANRDRLIGFTEFDAITALSHITYGAMIDQQGRFLIYERGVLIGQFGSYTAGATIRVSMLSNQTVAYYVDGALRYTSADTILPTSDLPLRGAAYLQSAGAKISNARVSFPPAPVRFAQATAGAGYTLSILTSVATDQPAGAVDDLWSFSHVIGAAYSGSWTTPSVYVITVTDTTGSTLQAGLSTVTAAGTVPILDSTPVTLSPAANGTSPVMIGPFNAEDDGRAVNWSNVTNASVAADNTLCKTSPTALNTSGARSTASVLAGDAFLQFQIDALDKTYAVGWANSDPDHALNTIDFAFYVDGNNGGLGIRENGLTIADGFGTLAIDDVLRIELSGGQILYKKNGATIYTSLQTLDPADYPYHVDVSLITQGACAFNVRTSMPADDQPIITAFSVSDPDDLDAVYSNGDVFEVKFDRATNRAPNGNGNILNTAEVDDLFTVHNLLTGPAVLGTGYSGRWASASCFSITVTDISDTVGIELSQLVIIPIGLTPILDSTGTSDASEAPSPFLTGRFGLPNQIVWEIPRDVRIDASSLQRINDPGNASNWSAGAQSTIFLTTGSAYLETRVGETTTNRMIGWTSLPAFDPGDDHHFSTIEWAAYLTAGGQFKVWRRPGRFVENLGSYSVNDIIRVAIDPAGPSVTWSVNGAVRYTFTPVVGTESELRYPVRVRASIETFAGTILDGTTNITPPSIPSIIGYSSAGNGSDTPDPGETYTITFSQATDQPFDDTVTLETTDIDSLFIFNGSIGSAYTGVWTTPSIFTITIVDGSGGSTPVGSATVTARGGPAPLELVIRNAAGTSNAAFTTSPALTGSARSATSGSGDSASEALTEAVTVSLSAGWSLIALPITPLDASAATLFGDLPVSQIHSRVGDIDLPATDLSVGTGYWAHNAGEGTEAVIIGVRSSGSRDLPAGWSTVGVPVSTAVPAGAVAYRHENGAFVPVETLEPGTGYWLHLDAPTTLTW